MPEIPDFSNPNSSLNNHKMIITKEEALLHFEQIKTRDPAIAAALEEQVKKAIEEKQSISQIIGIVFGFAKIFL